MLARWCTLAFALMAAPSVLATRVAAQLPAVTPTPQELRLRPDGFIVPSNVQFVGSDRADSAAMGVIVPALRNAGVRRVEIVASSSGCGERTVCVYVGGPGDGNAAAPALAAMSVEGPSRLAAGGYVLAIGRARGAPTIALAGIDADGTYYAAQTLRQLLVGASGHRIAGVVVRDWPAMHVRGVIEGFYGTPWSQATRLRQLTFYGEHKLGTYVYAPTDDPFHRERWREPYPAPKLAELAEVVAAARRSHVDVVFAISPGSTTCWSDDADFAALTRKAQAVWDIGVRGFAILLDDIEPRLRCARDRTRFGRDANPAAAGQAFLLNRFVRGFLATHPGSAPLWTVPTEYSEAGPSSYRARFAALVHSDVLVYWTGVGVSPAQITRSEASAMRELFQHELLLWDNYPCNDFARTQLFLAPLQGRGSDLYASLEGMTANPMAQAEASRLALATMADYAWNPEAYDAQRSWQRSVADIGGAAAPALAMFADASSSTIFQSGERSELGRAIAALWEGYRARSVDRPGRALVSRLAELEQAPGRMRSAMAGQPIVAEMAPWLDAIGPATRAATAATQMIIAQGRGDEAGAWRMRLDLEGRIPPLDAMPMLVARGVVDSFVDAARVESDRFLIGGRAAFTSMGTFDDARLEKATDGNEATWYWSGEPPARGDFVGIDLGAPRNARSITIHMGSLTGDDPRPDDYPREGVVEISVDQSYWSEVGRMTDRDTVVTLPAPARARYVRVRATVAQQDWIRVRELTVDSDAPTMTAEGGPPANAAPAAAMASAIDGRGSSAYRAARAPTQGEALTVRLGGARPISEVLVLQSATAPARARVEGHEPSGRWEPIGRLHAAYERMRLRGRVRTIDAVRLTWERGSPAPIIHEIVARQAAAEERTRAAAPSAL